MSNAIDCAVREVGDSAYISGSFFTDVSNMRTANEKLSCFHFDFDIINSKVRNVISGVRVISRPIMRLFQQHSVEYRPWSDRSIGTRHVGYSGLCLTLLLAAFCCFTASTPVHAQQGKDLTEKMVKESIENGKRFLLQQQGDNGAWNDLTYTVGKSSLSIMTLINCGMTLEDEPIQRGVKYLRTVREPMGTYEVALHIMALAAVKDGTRDAGKILSLSQRLAKTQVKGGENIGGWSYSMSDDRGGNASDRSNAQFAVLGLREAQYAGIPVNRNIWELVRDHWTNQQSADGGWSYSGVGGGSTGSMTVAGVTTQVIVETMLRDDKDENADGTPNCCGDPTRNESLERGVKWLERNFAVGHNPSNGNGIGGTLYYLYGLERAGRLSGRRFFGAHDWYREGADFLIRMQRTDGSWNGQGHGEEPI
ncbi:MAG: Prenyltransferase/squalene oxidase, partial [Planctomycetaceae bacterium]|nr:Prenyltransferase/squalene oxidase [Planctomycetaceae bacterium]